MHPLQISHTNITTQLIINNKRSVPFYRLNDIRRKYYKHFKHKSKHLFPKLNEKLVNNIFLKHFCKFSPRRLIWMCGWGRETAFDLYCGGGCCIVFSVILRNLQHLKYAAATICILCRTATMHTCAVHLVRHLCST